MFGFACKVRDAFTLVRNKDGRIDDIAGACTVRAGCDPIDAYRLTTPPGATSNELGEYGAGIIPGAPKELFSKSTSRMFLSLFWSHERTRI